MNLSALSQAIKLLADAVKDTMAALQPGQSAMAKLLAYSNLVPDIEALIPQIGSIGSEVGSLSPADYVTLTSQLVSDLAISDVKAQAIIASSLKLLSDLAVVILPDVQALISAAKSSDVVAPASPLGA